MFRAKKIVAIAASIAAVAAVSAQPAAAWYQSGTAYVSGGSATAAGYYDKGVHDWGSVYSNSSSCVHADVKLGLSGYNDYRWTEARTCGFNTSASFSKYHWGPILSTFYYSAVQGVYVRVCRERSYYSDVCGSWVQIGR